MKPIRLAADDIITDADFAALAEWVASKPRLSQGPEVKAFEEEWAAWLGVRHAVFCNSGSSANLLAYAALFESSKRGRQQSVAAPAVAWPTTIAPAVQYGAPITLLDADSWSWGMDMAQLEVLCIANTPDIVTIVDVLGIPADRDRLNALRDRYGFTLIEDCCGAHGATWRGQKVGTFGDLSTFSFFIGHHMTTGEGGMVCTNDDRLNRVLRQLRAHGWAVDLSPEEQRSLAVAESGLDPFRERFTFRMTGFNLRNTEFAAKLGRMQLGRLDASVFARQVNGAHYRTALANKGCVTYPHTDVGNPSPIAFAFLTKSKSQRDFISEKLAKAGVEHRAVGGGNMARQPFLRGYPKLMTPDLSTADEIHDRAIQVPCHPGLSSEDIARVCAMILGGT